MDRGKPLRRTALMLALVVLVAIVTEVASAVNAGIPKKLTGRWRGGGDGVLMVVSPRGKVAVVDFTAKFSHVTAHELTISGVPVCSGTRGRYHWSVASGHLKLKKLRDRCKQEVGLFAGTWSRA